MNNGLKQIKKIFFQPKKKYVCEAEKKLSCTNLQIM